MRSPVVPALFFVLGLALRLWNAGTAGIHDDELHAVSDAWWGVAPLGAVERLHFLRDHPRDHLRILPETGEMLPWGARGEATRLGHPCLFDYAAGVVLAIRRPSWPAGAVHTARVLNAVADVSTILLLPALARALGAGAGEGIVAAALYAIYPPAVTYGSIGNFDPLLAPLMVLLLLALTRTERGTGAWLAAGAATGLLVSAKQTGLIALVVVPVAVLLSPRRSVRGLTIWAVTAVLVLFAFTNPVAYVESLLNPTYSIGAVRAEPVAFLTGNLGFAARPSSYYWLSFSYHGRPLAPVMAHVHRVLTPAYLVAYAAGFVAALLRRRARTLLLLYLPAVLSLAFVEPSNGMWRFHIVAPLLCTAIACELGSLGARWRALAVALAAIAGMAALLPQRPGPDGRVDLSEILFMNPGARQPTGYYAPWKGRFLVVQVPSGVPLTRRLWLWPGRYEFRVTASPDVAISLDGMTLDREGTRDVSGALHLLRVESARGGTLGALAIRPVTDARR